MPDGTEEAMVVGYLRQIEKLAEKGDLDGVLLEAR